MRIRKRLNDMFSVIANDIFPQRYGGKSDITGDVIHLYKSLYNRTEWNIYTTTY